MSDDLIRVRFSLVLVNEFSSAGESDLCDILLHLIGRHTDTVILEFQCFFLVVDIDGDLRFITLGKFDLSDRIQFLSLGDRITAVGNQLTDKNILVRIHPLFDNRENILTVNR